MGHLVGVSYGHVLCVFGVGWWMGVVFWASVGWLLGSGSNWFVFKRCACLWGRFRERGWWMFVYLRDELLRLVVFMSGVNDLWWWDSLVVRGGYWIVIV